MLLRRSLGLAACCCVVSLGFPSGANGQATGARRIADQAPSQQNANNQAIQDRDVARKASASRSDGGRQTSGMDQVVADMVAIGNHGEIQLSKFAEGRTKSDDVRKFAQQMVEDHTKFLQQLHGFTNEQADDSADHRNRGQADAAGAAGRGGHSISASHLIQVKRQISQQCLANAERELEEKHGSEFDKCYLGMQLGMHAEMLAALQVVKAQVSEELRPILEKGLHVTEEHLQHAKQLMRQVEGQHDDSKSTSRTGAERK